jgi:hypothetical protein
MKRTVTVICGLLIFFAGIAEARARCKQVSFTSQDPQVTAHNHEHHSHSNHNHSHDSVIHCPSLDEFVPVANFSASKDIRAMLVPAALISELHLQFTPNGIRSIHGPPGFSRLNSIPHYLLLVS